MTVVIALATVAGCGRFGFDDNGSSWLEVAFTSPAEDSLVNRGNVAAFVVSGTCTEEGRAVDVSGAGAATATCNAGNWTTSVDLSAAPEGVVTLYADHADVAGKPVTQATRSFFKDTTLLQLTVSPVYPTAGRNWNDYVVNDGTDVFHASDTACAGNEAGGPPICIHGGEKLKVPVTAAHAVSCDGLTMRDQLGAFNWICAVEGGNAVFYAGGLADDRGLRHLVDAAAWKANQVSLRSGSIDIGNSSLAQWWNNPVTPLPNNATGALAMLSAVGTIYTLAASRASNGYHIAANKIGLVVLPGATLRFGDASAMNCRWYDGLLSTPDWICLISAGGRSFLWIEGSFDGQGSATNAYANILVSGANTSGRFSRIRGVQARHSSVTGILVRNKDGGDVSAVVSEITATDNAQDGLQLYAADQVYATRLVLANNGEDGLQVSYSNNNTFVDVVATNNGRAGLYVGATGGTTIHMATTANGRDAGAGGLYLWNNVRGTFSQHVHSNHGDGTDNHGIFEGSNSGTAGDRSERNLYAQTVVDRGGIWLQGTDSVFSGNLLITDPSGCAVSGGPNAGFVDGTCAMAGASDGHLVTGIDLAASFVAKVDIDDPVNLSDVSGQRLYDQITDWFGTANRWRAWGLDGGVFPSVNHRGRCSTGQTCRIWDWRLRATDVVLLDRSGDGQVANGAAGIGTACPAAVRSDVTLVDRQGKPNTYLLNALELVNDGRGDDDGLCESNEACVYAPSFGAYQGEGDITGRACVFQNGTGTNRVTGVTLYSYPTSGG